MSDNIGLPRAGSAEHFADVPHDPTKRQEAERRRAEADKRLRAITDPLVPEPAPAAPTRPFLDLIRDNLDSITPAERERMRSEDYRARRAALVAAEQKQHPGPGDELSVNALLGSDIDLDDPEFDDDDYLDDE